MNVDDLISRATHTSGRFLLAVATAVILSKWLGLPLNKFPVIATAENMTEVMVNKTALVLLAFLLVAHFINWWNDWLGYRASAIIDIYSREKEMAEGTVVHSGSTDKACDELVSEYLGTIKWTSRGQWISIYVQHLAAPLFLGLLAAGILICY